MTHREHLLAIIRRAVSESGMLTADKQHADNKDGKAVWRWHDHTRALPKEQEATRIYVTVPEEPQREQATAALALVAEALLDRAATVAEAEAVEPATYRTHHRVTDAHT